MKVKKKYCIKCGAEMKVSSFDDFSGYSRDTYDPDTGNIVHPTKTTYHIYTCPNWTWLFSSHDKYTDKPIFDSSQVP